LGSLDIVQQKTLTINRIRQPVGFGAEKYYRYDVVDEVAFDKVIRNTLQHSCTWSYYRASGRST
jgi:hypothetical protein